MLAHDAAFAERVATVTEPVEGRYQHDRVGEVRYLAIPVRLDGDLARGVIVAAYLGDAERESANDALDPQRIMQALVALADNACRFTEEGGWIGVGSQLSGGWLRFWVTDSGPGVGEGDRARIFERFARGDRRRSDGADLGLSIVRAIAVAHGGDVWLDSVPGRGATFTVAIPAVQEEQWRVS